MSTTKAVPAKVIKPGSRAAPATVVQAAALPFPDLVDLVVERIGVPADIYAVAATLESEGIRDLDARERFGSADVFDLAEDVFGAALQKVVEEQVIERDEPSILHGLKRFGHFYSRGVLFALPIVLQLTTVILVQVREDYTDAKATAVMIGSILSFFATGGFSQAIGRLGSTYTSRSAYHLTRRVVISVIVLGMLAALVTAGLWVIVAFTLEPFPQAVSMSALRYELLLSWLWLSLAVLYMLERRILVVAMVAIWLGVFSILLEFGGQSVETSQLVGYGVAAAIASVISVVELRRLEAGTPASARSERLPRWPVLFVGTAPYFVYGLLYFGLLFGDRVIGWSADPPDGFLFYFRRSYELGLDWAIVSLVLTVAALEYTIHELGALIEPTQKRFTGSRLREHNRAFMRFYLRQVALFAIVGTASGAATYAIVAKAHIFDGIPALHILVEDNETVRVFFIAVFAYGALAFGLMNAVVLFFLSRPRAPIFGLVAGGIATVVAGGIASRAIAPWGSAYGLLAGSIAFALVTGIATVRVVRRMDYFYYAAY